MNLVSKALLGALALSFAIDGKEESPRCFIYRDDIGAYWGIHGYEEQVTEVGCHTGHNHWPQYRFMGTFDSGSVRRGKDYYICYLANI
jgi:ubiquinol-cytochrome c reductase cytochrome c1 subunit